MKKETKEEKKKLKSAGFDEIYCEWYFCPICNEDMIESEANYCSSCGISLENYTI